MSASESESAKSPTGRDAPGQLRTNLKLSIGDATAFNMMVGLGETYLPAFALALGKGERISGLIATVPMLAGATLQLLVPYAVKRFGSYRRWVVACATLQALSFIPLAIAAFEGGISTFLLFVAAAVYWGSGQATVPVWNVWIEALIPSRIRAPYFACRTRVAQLGTLTGVIGGGLALHFGKQAGVELTVFGWSFIVAGTMRFLSSRCIAAQSDTRIVPQGTDSEFEPQDGKRPRILTKSNRRLLTYVFLMHGSVFLSGPFFTAYMREHLQFTNFDFMALIASSFAARIVVLPWLGGIAQRAGAHRLLWLGAIGITPLPGMWLVSDNFWFLLSLQVVGGMTWAAHELAMSLLLIDAIPRHNRIQALSIYNFGNAAAMVIGTLLGFAALSVWGEVQATYYGLFVTSSILRVTVLGVLKRVPDMHTGAVVPPPFGGAQPPVLRPSRPLIERPALCSADATKAATKL